MFVISPTEDNDVKITSSEKTQILTINQSLDLIYSLLDVILDILHK